MAAPGGPDGRRAGREATRPLVFLIALTVLSHAGYVGGRLSVSLTALELGGTALTVGVLMSLYALVPMILAVPAGRLVDRAGVLRPLAWSSAALTLGIVLPAVVPGLAALHVTAVVAGTAFMLQHVALNHAVGSLGAAADRPVNFSWLALGYAVSGFAGPLMAGFGIDLAGHRAVFLLLALPAAAAALLLLWRRPPPRAESGSADGAAHRIGDLLRIPRLRAAFLFSGLLATGWDLFTFVVPVYGAQIGLSASAIGVVMSSFALATFIVRLLMPVVSRRLGEWTVVCAALVIAGLAYSLFPFVRHAPLLMALSFGLGLGLGCAQPMIMAVLYSASPPGRQAEAVGVRSTLMNASHTFLPLVFGAVGAAVGVGPVFWAMSALLLGGGALAWRERRA